MCLIKKIIILVIPILFTLSANSQVSYEQKIGRLKGGGGVIYALFTFPFTTESGKMKLDSTKITYRMVLSLQKEINDEELILKYENIRSIKRLNTLLIFPNKLVIKMKNGTFHYFGTYKRKKIIEIVRSNIEVDS